MAQTGEPFQRLNVAQGKDAYDKQGAVWIDVREPAEWQRGRIPGAKLVVLDDLGHVPQEEDPARTVAEVRRFLGS